LIDTLILHILINNFRSDAKERKRRVFLEKLDRNPAGRDTREITVQGEEL
jgi:hypothetical protein